MAKLFALHNSRSNCETNLFFIYVYYGTHFTSIHAINCIKKVKCCIDSVLVRLLVDRYSKPQPIPTPAPSPYQPKAETNQPNPECNQPKAETNQPNPECYQPKPESNQPKPLPNPPLPSPNPPLFRNSAMITHICII